MNHRAENSIVKRFFHRIFVAIGSVALTLIFFLVLPFMQTIAKPPKSDLIVQEVETADIDPPPPPPEDMEQEPEPPPPPPPALAEEAPPLDLSQLELVMNAGISDGFMAGDFAVQLQSFAATGDDVDALFSLADLDQKPRAMYQPGPVMNKQMRAKAPGTVYIIFIVDKNGRVDSPKIQSSTDPIFELPALKAVKKWKFEPGKRNGEAVRSRMRVPITFPKGK